ncbi:efflux RND transporter periplasmic adaptor subunit [Xanthomarina gelatinilytica]|uniref:efflux RND transporter periplasmic adaptor subunit n=1 Tax=Xanthomarina gelatinilytica TaxID=1137281 RepID=UPI003AA9174E
MKNIYTLFIFILFIACGSSEENKPEIVEETNINEIVVSKQQFENQKIKLNKLTNHTFNKSVRTTGFIDVPPENRANVSTFISGYVKKAPLLIGDKVTKGQLIVVLENIEFVEIQQQYLEIAENLSYLKSEFKRQQTLYNEKIASEKNFLKAKSIYKSSLASYNGLRKKLQMMNIDLANLEQGNISSTINIYAPIDGFVTRVNISTGSFVSSSISIIEIINTDHIHLELLVFEKDILKIKKGQKIKFNIPESSDQNYNAEVHLIGTSIDDKNRTIKIHGHLENEKTNFVTGMFVNAEIITNKKTSKALPKEAVIEVDNSFYVLVLKSKKNDTYAFEKVKITIGESNESYVEILNINDLTNKEIATKGVYMLISESE